MKTVCVYHSIDLDGWMSAAIVKHWFNVEKECLQEEEAFRSGRSYSENPNGTIDFIGYNYGQPIPDLSEYDEVIMVDVSFPPEKMYEMYDKLTWIDHHISAINSVDYTIKGNRTVNFAACELTWKYFFPNEPMPEIVRLLGRYDCFGHKETDEEQKVLEFQYGARQCITNYEEAYEWLTRRSSEEVHIDIIHKQGIAIYQYLCTEAKQTYKNGFEIKLVEEITDPIGKNIVNRKFICVNKERFNPINFGIDYHKDGYDGCACYHFNGTKWSFSFYNDNGIVDCSIIAKQFGGGGHKGAAGCIVDNDTMLKIINNK